jgi:hypothetical protein
MPDPAKPDIKIVGTVASETATEHGLPFASTAGTNALSEYGLFAGLLVRRGWLPPWSLRRELGPAAGSCAFLNCHGDLRIEWEEKDHAAIVRLIAHKQAEGVRFFEVDHSGDKLVPINRRGPTGKHVIVRDDMLRQVIDAGFARFPATKFEATSASTAWNTRQLGDPEQISRAHTIAVPPMVRGDGLIATQQFEGDVIETKAIAEFLTSEPMQAIMGGRDTGPWDEKRPGASRPSADLQPTAPGCSPTSSRLVCRQKSRTRRDGPALQGRTGHYPR